MTLFEVVHTIKLPMMFHETAIDLITRKVDFDDEYGSKLIWYIEDVHERTRKLASISGSDFLEMSTNYVVSPFGALITKH
jgi:hypothetical protein